MLSSNLFLLFLSAAFPFEGVKGSIEYYGKYLGPLSRLNHGVSGEVYAVDARTLHIKDFTYDGEGPAAYFWAGNTKAPGPAGFRIRDENGSSGVLKRYNRKHITITLPEGKTLNSIRWFSVWCEEFAVNFGDVAIPRGLDFPKPQKIGALSGVHGVSSDNIVIVDAQTLLIPSFSYDGEAPDAKFWVGRGSKPSPQGIRVPDENGGITPLRRYDRKTIVLTLPNDLTVFDIGHFGVWCEAFTVDFGHVQVPPGLNVPPSLKMLGVSPQKRSLHLSNGLGVGEQERRVRGEEEEIGARRQGYQQRQEEIPYESILPLFNVQHISPTTYRPELHRFRRPQEHLEEQPGRVQILPSVPLAQFSPYQPTNLNRREEYQQNNYQQHNYQQHNLQYLQQQRPPSQHHQVEIQPSTRYTLQPQSFYRAQVLQRRSYEEDYRNYQGNGGRSHYFNPYSDPTPSMSRY